MTRSTRLAYDTINATEFVQIVVRCVRGTVLLTHMVR